MNMIETIISLLPTPIEFIILIVLNVIAWSILRIFLKNIDIWSLIMMMILSTIIFTLGNTS